MIERKPYSITFSPDDEERTGKGYYAEMHDFRTGETTEDSPLFTSKTEARTWVLDRDGDLDISTED